MAALIWFIMESHYNLMAINLIAVNLMAIKLMTVTKVGVYSELCNIFPKKLDPVSFFLSNYCSLSRVNQLAIPKLEKPFTQPKNDIKHFSSCI